MSENLENRPPEMKRVQSQEKDAQASNGWSIFVLNIASILGTIICFSITRDFGALIVIGFLLLITSIILLPGYFTLQPNEARVLLLFGNYKGTIRADGFHWINPLYTKEFISLRSRNFNVDKLKVNDKGGNPIEIGAVVLCGETEATPVLNTGTLYN